MNHQEELDKRTFREALKYAENISLGEGALKFIFTRLAKELEKMSEKIESIINRK